MNKELHLHDISDSTSEKTKPHIIEKNGVFWILRTGKPWRDLPAECGYWKNVPSALIDGASFECLASLFYCKKSYAKGSSFATVVHSHLAILAKLPLARGYC